MMKPGDTVECAIWMDGRETPEQRQQFEKDVQIAMVEGQAQHGAILGPVIWAEKQPGDDRVPPVPEHIAGPNVRLLVAEARVIGLVANINNPVGFVHDLEPDDHALLRRITRRQYEVQYPGQLRLTDRQCDTLINDLGPDAALATLQSLAPSDLH
jgi:hypothetical protein